MQKNKVIEEWLKIDTGILYKASKGRYRLCMAYNRSIKNGSNILEFDDIIWQEEVVELVEALKTAGISKFAITVRTTNLIDMSALLEAHGCILKGTAVVERRTRNEIVNGLIFRVVK